MPKTSGFQLDSAGIGLCCRAAERGVALGASIRDAGRAQRRPTSAGSGIPSLRDALPRNTIRPASVEVVQLRPLHVVRRERVRDTDVVTLGRRDIPLQSEPTANDQPKPMAERPAVNRRARDNDRCR